MALLLLSIEMKYYFFPLRLNHYLDALVSLDPRDVWSMLRRKQRVGRADRIVFIFQLNPLDWYLHALKSRGSIVWSSEFIYSRLLLVSFEVAHNPESWCAVKWETMQHYGHRLCVCFQGNGGVSGLVEHWMNVGGLIKTNTSVASTSCLFARFSRLTKDENLPKTTSSVTLNGGFGSGLLLTMRSSDGPMTC